MTGDKTELFSSKPIHAAVLSLVVPTIISQLITVIYNMADTFFVGQMKNPAKVAAVSVAMPAFVMLTGIANLFGLGGASLISRKLGGCDPEGAKNTASFCLFCGIVIALIYGLLFIALRPAVLPLLGATSDTFDFAYRYILWTTTIGAMPTVLNALLTHLVRAEGAAGWIWRGVGWRSEHHLRPDLYFSASHGAYRCSHSDHGIELCCRAVLSGVSLYTPRNDGCGLSSFQGVIQKKYTKRSRACRPARFCHDSDVRDFH